MNTANYQLSQRIQAYLHVLSVYATFMQNHVTVCRRYCSHCCTSNVTMSTIEGNIINSYLQEHLPLYWRDILNPESNPKRFQPKMTINQLARYCYEDADIPEESIEPQSGECPFLKNHECMIYEVRPFACRSFVSKELCADHGSALVDPIVLTMNELCMQYIEHIDRNGFTGNLIDVLRYLKRSEDVLQENLTEHLVHNSPIHVLMIPNEHQQTILPYIEQLQGSMAKTKK
ncbi:MAG: YkgJ family cysteine cluster protein [Desulfobacterales bacterium]|nr:YkgJ family cysteine cluster protein [Desulfobacterales bacterium]